MHPTCKQNTMREHNNTSITNHWWIMERILTQHAFKYKYKPLTQHLKEALETIQSLYCLEIISHAKDHAHPIHNPQARYSLSINQPPIPKKLQQNNPQHRSQITTQISPHNLKTPTTYYSILLYISYIYTILSPQWTGSKPNLDSTLSSKQLYPYKNHIYN